MRRSSRRYSQTKRISRAVHAMSEAADGAFGSAACDVAGLFRWCVQGIAQSAHGRPHGPLLRSTNAVFRPTTTITITLPDQLAQETQGAGLLSPAKLEHCAPSLRGAASRDEAILVLQPKTPPDPGRLDPSAR
jgi:hypothetical protein